MADDVCLCTAALPDVLERCCSVGRLWFATNRQRCSVYPSSVPGVARAHRAACSAVIDLCCMTQRQDSQCARGKQTARQRAGRCDALSGRPGSEHARVSTHYSVVHLVRRLLLPRAQWRRSVVK